MVAKWLNVQRNPRRAKGSGFCGHSWVAGILRGRFSRLLEAGWSGYISTMKLDIDLTPAQAEKLRQEAERLKITPEELARAAVTDLLSERDQDFKVAVERVLQKYSELYRRLA